LISKDDIRIPIVFVIVGLISLMIFHAWFSSFIGEDEWKKPTPIPESLENLYIWPKGVNYLGTPEAESIDPFRQKVIDNYKKYMEKRRNKYEEWKLKNGY
tara:strand:- start:706 stop:1005 length:300 start_codon:yes stop_codon:yes gene_type:complete